ncbi:hypothetical protein LguiB_007622 [Lonicera macranthoides]
MSMFRRISTFAKLTLYSSFIPPYIVTKFQKAPSPFSSKFYSSNSQKKPLNDIGLICYGLKLEEFQQKEEKQNEKEEANEKKEKNKDEEEENEMNEQTGVEGEKDEFYKKFDESLEHVKVEEGDDLPPGRTQIVISTYEDEISEHKFNPGDFPMDRVKDFFTDFVLLVSSPELVAKLIVVLRDIATKGLWTAWRNVWEKFSLHVKDYACMSKRDFESLITVSSELKTYADVLEKEEKENPKGGGKAGEKKDEEKKGE